MSVQNHGGHAGKAPAGTETYTDLNARIIDSWIAEGWEWGTPISHERYLAALEGDWTMVLTPTRPVPRSWLLPDMRGKRVLGLASGGGQQMPVFAAMGAECTVLDYSASQIASERLVAEREGYRIATVRADMTKPLPFGDGAFDLVFHPVSNCYIEEVLPVWRECFRVLAPGGRLLAGLDNGFNYTVDDDERRIIRGLPFNPLRDSSLIPLEDLPEWGMQFSHTLDEQIRGQIQAGFRIVDLYEDTNGEGRLHELGIPTFWATCAEKPAAGDDPSAASHRGGTAAGRA